MSDIDAEFERLSQRLAGDVTAADRRESVILTASVLLSVLGFAATIVVAWIQRSWLTVLAGGALCALAVVAGALTAGLVNQIKSRN